MREKEYINIIQKTLDSGYIGDDCAYLKDLGTTITQDNLVENVHFSTKFATPYQIGYKSVMVNISDICASGAKPEYLTIGLSLPNEVDSKFVREFYLGAKEAAGDVKIVGGDITGADKIFISVCALGSTTGRKISSRSNAKAGQKIVISGNHGSSGAGLRILMGENYTQLSSEERDKLINAHLMPVAEIKFSEMIAKNQHNDYAMMDTSDGLADALNAISQSSGVMLEIDFDKVPYFDFLEKIPDYKNLILYGGEDYGLVATVDEPLDNMIIIGEVKAGAGVKINYSDTSVLLSSSDIENKLYKHFAE